MQLEFSNWPISLKQKRNLQQAGVLLLLEEKVVLNLHMRYSPGIYASGLLSMTLRQETLFYHLEVLVLRLK